MTKSAHNCTDHATYEFWLWEYQRRNAAYREAVTDYFSQTSELLQELPYGQRHPPELALGPVEWSCPIPNPSPMLSTHEVDLPLPLALKLGIIDPVRYWDFVRQHRRAPRLPEEGPSAEEIIIRYVIPAKCPRLDKNLFQIAPMATEFAYDPQTDTLDFRVDLDLDSRLVRLEVDLIIAQHKAARSLQDQKAPAGKALNTSQECLENLLKYWRLKTGKKKTKLPTDRHALGLWLWDRSQELGDSTQAIRDFRDRWLDGETKPSYVSDFLKYTGSSVASTLLKKTNECIEKAEVLSLS